MSKIDHTLRAWARIAMSNGGPLQILSGTMRESMTEELYGLRCRADLTVFLMMVGGRVYARWRVTALDASRTILETNW